MKNILLVLLLLTSPGVFGQTPAEKDLRRGRELLDAKKYDEAIEKLNGCAGQTNNPKMGGECVFYRGKAYQRKGLKDQAQADFEKALKLDAENKQVTEALKNFKLNVDQVVKKGQEIHNEPSADVIEFLIDYPEFADDPSILNLSSEGFMKGGEFSKADVVYQKLFDFYYQAASRLEADAGKREKSAATNPKSRKFVLESYANSLLSYGLADFFNHRRLLRYKEFGITEDQIKSPNLRGYENLHGYWEQAAMKAAAVNFKLGNFQDAANQFGRAVTLNPDNTAAYQGRAKAYRKLGKIALAIADEKKVSELKK